METTNHDNLVNLLNNLISEEKSPMKIRIFKGLGISIEVRSTKERHATFNNMKDLFWSCEPIGYTVASVNIINDTLWIDIVEKI